VRSNAGEVNERRTKEPVGSPEATVRRHAVVEGDTLTGVAQRYYGDASLWPLIWEHNEGLANPDLIYPGTVLEIPDPRTAVRESDQG
jgi:nucleoid-associated protein YgaU